jgi:hypothetical protein
MPELLEPNRDQLATFINAIFKYAGTEGYVAIRAFYENEDETFRLSPTPLTGGLDFIIEVAEDDARRAAQFPEPIVFCPPLAVFSNRGHAGEADVLLGLVLSTECDSNPAAARATLEAILGPATVDVRSGGKWTNGNGEIEDKLHLHWRLAVPASDAEALVKLKQARMLATALVGGDPTNNPVPHPIRWPGSWHRKAEPRLCEIVTLNGEVEINLDAALAALQTAAQAAGINIDPAAHVPSEEAQAPASLVVASVAVIPNDFPDPAISYNEWVRIGLAIYAASGGSEEGFVIFDQWSRKNVQGRYNAANTRNKWRGFHRTPPNRIGVGTLFYLADKADAHWSDEIEMRAYTPNWGDAEPIAAPTAGDDDASATGNADTDEQTASNNNGDAGHGDQPNEDSNQNDAGAGASSASAEPQSEDTTAPVDLWNKFEPPTLPTGLLPATIEAFALEQGTLMGADPAGLAMAALTICAAAVPDRIKLKVMRHGRWMESTRLWVAIVGDPSSKKTPIINEASWPFVQMDHEKWRDYCSAKARYDALTREERQSNTPPKKTRLLLEDTTIEAAQEIFRDSPDGLLCLRDELSGWFGSMDKYAGHRGAAMDRGFWLQAYNGVSYSYNRVGRGEGFIENLSASVLGGIQPEPMRKVMEGAVDDGLVQRVIPILLRPATARQDAPTAEIVTRYAALVRQLRTMTPPFDHMVFDDEALAVRQELEAKHLNLMTCVDVNRKLAAHIGKYDGIFARLCLLWHCIAHCTERRPQDEPHPVITAAIATKVAHFLHGFLLPHARAFYFNVFGVSDDHPRLTAIAGYILAHKLEVVTNRDVQRGDRAMRRIDRQDIASLFHQLHALGWVHAIPNLPTRDTTRWLVNPEVHRLFAARAAQEAARRAQARELMASLFGR